LATHALRHLRGGHDAGAREHEQDTLVVRQHVVTHPAAVKHLLRVRVRVRGVRVRVSTRLGTESVFIGLDSQTCVPSGCCCSQEVPLPSL